MALRGNLNGVSAHLFELSHDPPEARRRLAKVMVRNQNSRRGECAAQFIPRHSLRRFNLHIAPPAARPYGLSQDLELRLGAPSKQPSALSTAARGDQDGSRGVTAQPAKERAPLLRPAQIVQPQLQRPRSGQGQTDLCLHPSRRLGGNHPANSVCPEQALHAPSTPKTTEAKLYASTMWVTNV